MTSTSLNKSIYLFGVIISSSHVPNPDLFIIIECCCYFGDMMLMTCLSFFGSYYYYYYYFYLFYYHSSSYCAHPPLHPNYLSTKSSFPTSYSPSIAYSYNVVAMWYSSETSKSLYMEYHTPIQCDMSLMLVGIKWSFIVRGFTLLACSQLICPDKRFSFFLSVVANQPTNTCCVIRLPLVFLLACHMMTFS